MSQLTQRRLASPAKSAPRQAAPSDPPAVKTTFHVKRLELALRAEIDAIVADYDVTGPQYTALSLIGQYPEMSSAQLARFTHVSAQAAGEVVSALERKGLIERNEDARNRRILLISLSRKGKKVLASCDKGVGRLDFQMTSALSERSHQQIRKALQSCLGALENDTPGTGA
jgi:DNA-binding MarR family transcriptional regulator